MDPSQCHHGRLVSYVKLLTVEGTWPFGLQQIINDGTIVVSNNLICCHSEKKKNSVG